MKVTSSDSDHTKTQKLTHNKIRREEVNHNQYFDTLISFKEVSFVLTALLNNFLIFISPFLHKNAALICDMVWSHIGELNMVWTFVWDKCIMNFFVFDKSGIYPPVSLKQIVFGSIKQLILTTKSLKSWNNHIWRPQTELISKFKLRRIMLLFSFQAWGVLEQRIGNLSVARRLFRSSLNINSQSYVTWMTWASLEEKRGNTVRAEEIRNLYFQQVI